MISTAHAGRKRGRDLGIQIGRFPPGQWNAITDVAGVRVGQTTLHEGEGELVVGKGPVRTGVTVIMPHEGDIGLDPLFAGYHQLNGNGEMTGVLWIMESGLLTTPIAITNTHSAGVVRDSLIAHRVDFGQPGGHYDFSLPVAGETYDGYLNDINGFHVRKEHVYAALENASGGAVVEGCVGGGMGMLSFGFKGGTGTASRLLPAELGGWTTGVLVQSNFGQRHLFTVDGVAVGEAIPDSEVPAPIRKPWSPGGDGSIIVIIATDAPLLPHQCRRLAQRATIGVGRMGGLGEDSSGDLFLAFSTGNRGFETGSDGTPKPVRVFPSNFMTVLFESVVEAVQEAILNAMCAAVTTTGRDHHIAYELPQDRLQQVMRAAGRLGTA